MGKRKKPPYYIWYKKGESALQIICRALFLRRSEKNFCL